jgi:hypothetical protein
MSNIRTDQERDKLETTIQNLEPMLLYINNQIEKDRLRERISGYQKSIDDYDKAQGSRTFSKVLKKTGEIVFGTPHPRHLGGKGKTRRRKQRRIKTTKTSKRNKKGKKTK